jgi:ubiquinone/menaquinone biosynthesis C-methylase UbiE
MNNREFFNRVAFKWDQMCNHNVEKLRKIIDLTSVKSNSKILDVGTGTGVLIKYLLETSPSKIVGVDIAENMIKVAKQKYKNDSVEFIVSDILEYNQKGFDYVFLYSVYPHFADKDALFMQLSKLMKKDGKIVIAHSESKEKINARHAESEAVKNHVLPSAEVTSKLMSKYFTINNKIDNGEMYYIMGVKNKGLL